MIKPFKTIYIHVIDSRITKYSFEWIHRIPITYDQIQNMIGWKAYKKLTLNQNSIIMIILQWKFQNDKYTNELYLFHDTYVHFSQNNEMILKDQVICKI